MENNEQSSGADNNAADEKKAVNKASVPEKPNNEVTQVCNETPVEIGGPKGLEPTRYGDWEQKGRCTDF